MTSETICGDWWAWSEPTRMDYATVAARLSYFAESLGRMFGKNQLPPKEDQET